MSFPNKRTLVQAEHSGMARVSKYRDNRERVLEMIARAMLQHGRPPTVRALASETGVGVATMHSYLEQLREEGMVEWQPKHHRSLRATPAAFQQLSSQGVL